MSAPPSKTPPLLDRQQVIRGLHPLMLKGGLVLSAAIVLQYVGQWRLMAWALAGCGVRVGGNMLLTRVFRARFTATSVEWVRLALNGACQVWIGLGAGWSLLLWSYLPFSVAGFYGADRQGRIRAIVFVGFVNTVALLSGCDPFQPLAFTLIGGVSFLVTERRAELLQQSLEQSLAQREQLQRAELRLRRIHERAFCPTRGRRRSQGGWCGCPRSPRAMGWAWRSVIRGRG